jgi:hypothetical protein
MRSVRTVATRQTRFWLCALTLATASAPPSADAQSDAPPAAAESPVAASEAHADDAIRYRVKIVAPDGIAATIAAAVDLVRWQDYADMTEELLDRWRARPASGA